jgi:hypothetical protein
MRSIIGDQTMTNQPKTDDKQLLKNHVLSIIDGLENGITYDECGMDHDADGREATDIISGMDYLNDVLDIEYTVNGEGQYLGARILVAFGGPNIWVDTRRQTVEGAWWGDNYTESYHTDAMDIDDACREVFSCTINYR